MSHREVEARYVTVYSEGKLKFGSEILSATLKCTADKIDVTNFESASDLGGGLFYGPIIGMVTSYLSISLSPFTEVKPLPPGYVYEVSFIGKDFRTDFWDVVLCSVSAVVRISSSSSLYKEEEPVLEFVGKGMNYMDVARFDSPSLIPFYPSLPHPDPSSLFVFEDAILWGPKGDEKIFNQGIYADWLEDRGYVEYSTMVRTKGFDWMERSRCEESISTEVPVVESPPLLHGSSRN